jgi:hypothetical protein
LAVTEPASHDTLSRRKVALEVFCTRMPSPGEFLRVTVSMVKPAAVTSIPLAALPVIPPSPTGRCWLRKSKTTPGAVPFTVMFGVVTESSAVKR